MQVRNLSGYLLANYPASASPLGGYRETRQANRALWNIVITRLVSDPRTQAYKERRVKDGRSRSEAIRMLKRYVAREVYRASCLAPRSPGRGPGSPNACRPAGLT